MSGAGSAITDQDVATWRAQVGREEQRRQRLDVETLRRYAAAVGGDLDVARHPPPLGHWAYFLETAAADRLGPDGHARRDADSLLPPVPRPRRMFAGATIDFLAPLVLDADAELTLRLEAVEHKAGRGGDLVFIKVRRLLTQAGAPRILELQTLVYRGQGGPTPAPAPDPKLATPADAELWRPGAVDLFRFSAATFNSHRIHYDQVYAGTAEGYPGLVVQGPFTAARLCGFAGDPAAIRRFEFRALAPLFADQPVLLAPAPDGGVQALRCDGTVAMSARAAF